MGSRSSCDALSRLITKWKSTKGWGVESKISTLKKLRKFGLKYRGFCFLFFLVEKVTIVLLLFICEVILCTILYHCINAFICL
ncbi:hypothetical protein MtrunA17_Chr2g0295221 [Medicago truncatula]|uniref:Transmembrane protein n=1 Tax=Medicago truncatula TaxID=3880 RepID=A0A396JA31_MEDTR|nr:hypothetical protein MtrunA17_Chr2g0295221 [Medicago truncatula]